MAKISSQRHDKRKDILVIVLFVALANADDRVEIAMFAREYQDYLHRYIELKNGISSHGTINRVMGLISLESLQQLYGKWQELQEQKCQECVEACPGALEAILAEY